MKINNLINYTKQEFSKAKFLESWFFIKSEVKEIFFYPNFKKHFIFLYSIYLIGYAALLRANVNFIDDKFRAFSGISGWNDFSRYLSNFFSHFLHMGWNLLDQSPINQLIAIAIISLSSVFLTRIFFKKEEITYWHLLASLPIGLSPFFLQNIAFKFDSPYMVLAVLASIFPFLFIKNKLSFYIVGILSLLITLTTYQAGHQVFIEVSIFLILKYYLDNTTKQEIKEFIFICLLVFFISILIFKLFIYNPIHSGKNYTLLLMPHEIPSEGYNNLKRYFLIIYNSFNGTFFFNILVFSLILAIINVAIKYKSIVKVFLSMLLLIFAFISSMGLFIFLENPSLLYRVRNFNGFAMLLVGVLFLVCINNNKTFSILNKSVIFLYCCNLLVFSNIFGNAVKIQNDYKNYRILSVINTLNTTEINNIVTNLAYDGEILVKFPENGTIIAPQLHNNYKYLPLLKYCDIFTFSINDLIYFNKYSTSKYENDVYARKFLGIKLKKAGYSCLSKNSRIISLQDTLLHKITYYSNNCAELEFK